MLQYCIFDVVTLDGNLRFLFTILLHRIGMSQIGKTIGEVEDVEVAWDGVDWDRICKSKFPLMYTSHSLAHFN